MSASPIKSDIWAIFEILKFEGNGNRHQLRHQKKISPEKIQLELNKLAKAAKTLSVNDLRMVLALERVIARIENHKKLSKHFVFKGGFVLLKTVNSERFTRDVDALATGRSRKQVPGLVEDALSQNLEDGIWFGDVKTDDLVNQGPYGGYTFNAAFTIGKAPSVKDPKIKKSLDYAFGKSVPAYARGKKGRSSSPFRFTSNRTLFFEKPKRKAMSLREPAAIFVLFSYDLSACGGNAGLDFKINLCEINGIK